jgi:hypoxanthine phosphoribosyltransferase
MTKITHTVEVLIPAMDIAGRVKWIAQKIAEDMPQDLVIVGLLRGSFMFTSDLIRALHFEDVKPQIDFLTLSSYGAGITSTGSVEINRDIKESVAGRDVLIVDDILETGQTLSFARDLIAKRGAKSIKSAVLLEKPGKRKIDIQADYVGFVIEDKFVVGYGLDYANSYRELPYIGVLANKS